jgi:[acyl-carrier-protein] S-malonyltransferase
LVVVANDNAPGQIVISGESAAVAKASEIAKSKGAKRVIPLSVSAPFHSPLLQPAAEQMHEALAQVTIRPPAAPLVANVTAAETAEPDTIRRLLVEQVTGRVRWRESVASFRALGVTKTVEAGGNKVLTGMVKRIDKELETVTLDTPADIETFAGTL